MQIDPQKVKRLFPLAAWVALCVVAQLSLGVALGIYALIAVVFYVGCYLVNPVNNWPALERLSGFCIFLMSGWKTLEVIVLGILLIEGTDAIYLPANSARFVYGIFGVARVASYVGFAGWMLSIIIWLLLDPPPPPKRRRKRTNGKSRSGKKLGWQV